VEADPAVVVRVAEAAAAVGGVAEVVRVRHLPPVVLSFSLPKDYPEKSMPEFTLEALWIDQDKVIGNYNRGLFRFICVIADMMSYTVSNIAQRLL
jgi:hypothetical protein